MLVDSRNIVRISKKARKVGSNRAGKTIKEILQQEIKELREAIAGLGEQTEPCRGQWMLLCFVLILYTSEEAPHGIGKSEIDNGT